MYTASPSGRYFWQIYAAPLEHLLPFQQRRVAIVAAGLSDRWRKPGVVVIVLPVVGACVE